MSEKKVSVKNRGIGSVCYTIPDLGVRRDFLAGETKRNIAVDELEKLMYIPGGKKLAEKYLLISDKEVAEELGLETPPEYFYDEEQVKYILQAADIDTFLDCLDFAPDGVLDMIKRLSVTTEINDMRKRAAIKTSLGFDVSAAIENDKYDKEDSLETSDKQRRTNGLGDTAPTEGRRTAGIELPKYDVVSRG